jgi:histone-lysine N-methyltransferase SETMAR
MPRREKYSTWYYVHNILTRFCPRLIPAGKCKLAIHADNSPCHTAHVVLDFVSQRKVRFAPHLPYSPDIAPSDFFLFDDLKHELRDSRFQTGEELRAEIRKLVDEISPETLLDFFHD